MPTEVLMPQMGESIAEGTIVRWIKKVGDRIDRDEPLFEISTDKVDAEIPSPGAGILIDIRVNEGDTVPVNSIVALIGAEGEQVSGAPLRRRVPSRGLRLTGAVRRPMDCRRAPAGSIPETAAPDRRSDERIADARRSSPHEIVPGRAEDREGARHRHHATERHGDFRTRDEEGHPRVRRERGASGAPAPGRREPPVSPGPQRRRRRLRPASPCASRRCP